jgi:predicted hydrocarbon binding protein
MSLKGFFEGILIKIDSSETTNKVLTIFQVLAAASIGVYTIYAESQTDIAGLSVYTFWFFQSIVLLYFFGMVLISGKYRAIKLRLSRTTGVLYDATTNFRNVSLRGETLNIILDSIGDSEKTYKIGKNAGENFYSAYELELQRKGKILNAEDQLKKWVEYDSSSGMGKFEVLQTGFLTKLKITSPFTGTCPDQSSNPRCSFLLGYIEGFCSKLYEKELKIKCEHNPNPPFCILTLEPAN